MPVIFACIYVRLPPLLPLSSPIASKKKVGSIFRTKTERRWKRINKNKKKAKQVSSHTLRKTARVAMLEEVNGICDQLVVEVRDGCSLEIEDERCLERVLL